MPVFWKLNEIIWGKIFNFTMNILTVFIDPEQMNHIVLFFIHIFFIVVSTILVFIYLFVDSIPIINLKDSFTHFCFLICHCYIILSIIFQILKSISLYLLNYI